MSSSIVIKGARENNLKNIQVEIPRDQLTVITGVSGSGKSSLAFDVIYGEGQRRFLESFSSFAKRFVAQMKKPDVDFVHGLSPVVALEQKKGSSNPRSTVGTMTDIYDYLRLFFAVSGTAHCPFCSSEIPVKTPNQMAEKILTLPRGTIIMISSPVKKIYGETYAYLFDEIRSQGFRWIRIDGQLRDLTQTIDLDEDNTYSLEVIIDKITVMEEVRKSLTRSIENGLKTIAEGLIRFDIEGDLPLTMIHDFYNGFSCPEHHLVTGELLPFYFSSNDPDSACLTCGGLGTIQKADPELMIEHPGKSLRQGALCNTIFSVKHPFKYALLYSLGQAYGFDMDTPYRELSTHAKELILYGTRGQRFPLVMPDPAQRPDPNAGKLFSFEGIITQVDRWYRYTKRKRTPNSVEERAFQKVMTEHSCPDCNGKKLKWQRSLVTIGGQDIHALGAMPVYTLRQFLTQLKFSEEKQRISEPIRDELLKRLDLMLEIGLDYLSLNRRADTLSGGEIQRARLATQIGAGLMGMLYVLDEPSIGLHARDTRKIIQTLEKLRDIGNTVIVVEHDPDTIVAADHIIEIGPGPGIHGGEVVAQGPLESIKTNSASLTGQYISGTRNIPVPRRRRSPGEAWVNILGARENNLKNVDVGIPLGLLVCVTGVSGSGKSSLIHEILCKSLSARRNHRIRPGIYDRILGLEHIREIITIDQTPIGRSSRSDPATYVGFFDRIRQLFSELPESIALSYTESHFSFNHKEGRCDECAGNGRIITELQFMPDIESPCPVCHGARYHQDILEVKYRGKIISEILDMSVEEAQIFFHDHPYIHHKLDTLERLGLGYIKLGQSSSTISGGEAQRIKLATELSKIKGKHGNLYVLDEPTTGLHLADIQRLMDCLNQLVEAGNTVLVIEHHLDVIKCADYIIDMGPDGGENGGYLVATGPPEEIVGVSGSFTGQYLKPYLQVAAV